jgi:hypothetical protein
MCHSFYSCSNILNMVIFRTPSGSSLYSLYICVNPTTPKSSEKVGTTDITGAVLSTRKPLDEDSLHSPIIKQMTVSLFYIMHRLVISFFPINEIDDGFIKRQFLSIKSHIGGEFMLSSESVREPHENYFCNISPLFIRI